MFVCVRVCACVCVRVCVCVSLPIYRVPKDTAREVCVYMYVCMYALVPKTLHMRNVYICACTHVCTIVKDTRPAKYVCVYVFMYVCMCTHIYGSVQLYLGSV